MSDDIRKTFWETLEDSPYLMVKLENGHDHALPMTAQLDKHADSAFWFYTTRDNRLAAGGPAMAQHMNRKHDLFACISGTLVEETDPAVIDRYWSNEVAAWFKGGRQDPNMMMMRFDLSDAEIWTSDLGIKGMFKLMAGATIKPSESGKHEQVAL